MSITSNAGKIIHFFTRAIDSRTQRRDWARYESSREPVPSDNFAAAIYFADEPVNMYQIQQWYAPMLELSKSTPVAVIARDIRTANTLRRECPLPVVWLPYIADVERWVASQCLGAVFYLNQNTLNFSMLRFRKPAHVFLSHGESDKDYMASNQLKAYDYTFIAGDAARARIATKLIGFDVTKRTVEIGRPQVDVDYSGPELPTDDRKVVLYAPTWEGDRPSMSYSSVVSHGEEMLRALVATGKYRVIYRPHPRTGIADNRYQSVHKTLVAILEEANTADPGAFHMVDVDTAFGWHLHSADECVTDISAVAFDWLATGKPLLLTRPLSADAEIDQTGIAGTLPMVSASDASDVATLLAATKSASQSSARAELAERYFGETGPGLSMHRWVAAAQSVVEQRTARPAP